MKNVLMFFYILGCVTHTWSAEPQYPVSSIPEQLKTNAHTVYRYYKSEMEIVNENSVKVKITEVRTILNKNGEDNVFFRELYNPMNKITSVKGAVYNDAGKKIRSLSGEDATDVSNMGSSMFDENRVKSIDPKYLTYPMTVMYEYDLTLKQSLFLPGFFVNGSNTSYEQVEISVTTPGDFKLKYKEYQFPVKCNITSKGDKSVYLWKFNALPARISEPFSQHYKPNTPTLLLTSENFSVDDSSGSTSSWKAFGDWSYQLNKGKDNLPEGTRNAIRELTTGLKTDIEKVKAVYEFMQKKTRYVSVQIGIGGWQPFAAEIVDKNSYGDCKALSNYTQALLTAAGIKSHYVLVQAGSGAKEIDTGFVSSQFNHAIICVPLKNDTIWLETTSQLSPFGHTGKFTDDRLVLLIDSGNSRLVRTRVYPATENSINRTANVIITEDKSAKAVVGTMYTGLAYDMMTDIIYSDNNEKKRKITNRIDIPGFVLNDFSLTENRCRVPEVKEYLNLDINNCIQSMNGSVELLSLNLMNKMTSIPDKIRNRKNELCIRRAYMENDSITYTLPANYVVVEIPESHRFETPYGKYEATVKCAANTVTYIRRFQLFKGLFPSDEYAAYREFMEKVAVSDELLLPVKRTY
jgi:hypothetical protein